MNTHEYNKKQGYEVLKIIEAKNYLGAFFAEVLEINYKKQAKEINDGLVIPTSMVPRSIEGTNYQNRSNLDGLMTVYIKKNKTQN